MTEEEVLSNFGKELVFQIVNLLVKNKKVDTGNLKKSIRYGIDKSGGAMRLYIYDLSGYFNFVDNGVNGTEVNRGSPFSFKTGPGPKKLKGWVGRKLKPEKGSLDSVSFAVSNSIRKKGIKPANASYRIVDEAWRIAWEKWKMRLSRDYKELYSDLIKEELKKIKFKK